MTTILGICVSGSASFFGSGATDRMKVGRERQQKNGCLPEVAGSSWQLGLLQRTQQAGIMGGIKEAYM